MVTQFSAALPACALISCKERSDNPQKQEADAGYNIQPEGVAVGSFLGLVDGIATIDYDTKQAKETCIHRERQANTTVQQFILPAACLSIDPCLQKQWCIEPWSTGPSSS